MDEQKKVVFLEEPLELLIGWLAITVAGFYLGSWGGDYLIQRVELGPRLAEILIAFAVQGLCIGFGQWWLLRGRLPAAGVWILVTAVGFSLVGFVQEVSAPLARNSAMLEVVLIVVQGGLLGLIQWFYLRKLVAQAHWWIGVCALSAFIHSQLARILFLLVPTQWLFDAVAAVTLGAVTAYAMFVFIENRPKDKPKPEKLHRSLRPRPNRFKKKAKTPRPAPSQPAAPVEVARDPVEPAAAPRVEAPPRQVSSAAPRGKPPDKLVLVKKKTKLHETSESFSARADFVFVLPSRPRRARLRLTYSGMSEATQAYFRQHVQLNDQTVFELQPRGRKLGDVDEYVLRLAAELFTHRNRIVILSESDGRPQGKNPFVLHAARLEFDW